MSGTDAEKIDPLSDLIRSAVKGALKEFTDDVVRVRPRLLSLQQCADYMGRTPAAIRQLVNDGKLPTFRQDKRVMFDIQDLDHMIDSQKIRS